MISVVNENVSLVISRQLLSDFCSHLSKLADPLAKQVAHFTLEKVHTRVISFEEQVINLFNPSTAVLPVRNVPDQSMDYTILDT